MKVLSVLLILVFLVGCGSSAKTTTTASTTVAAGQTEDDDIQRYLKVGNTNLRFYGKVEADKAKKEFLFKPTVEEFLADIKAALDGDQEAIDKWNKEVIPVFEDYSKRMSKFLPDYTIVFKNPLDESKLFATFKHGMNIVNELEGK